MQRDLVVKGRGLGSSTDLTLLAKIKPGFVESLDSVSYKTRVKRVLDALHLGRTQGHEFAAARLLSDSVERVGAIQSVRVVVFEPEDQVMLSVSFDGSWQAYLRVLWEKVGTLLDLIFCGTVDYVTACDHSYEEWCAWARRVQVETGFFYGPTEGNARDVLFHRRVERMAQRGAGSELNELRAVLPSAEQLAEQLVVPKSPLQPDDAPVVQPPVPMRAVLELFQTGLQGLSGLYRLTDLHRPGTPDGEVLRRAALELLREFVNLCADGALADALALARADRFARPLAWLGGGGPIAMPTRPNLPPSPNEQPDRVPDTALSRLQGGIVRAYEGVSHGAVLLLAFEQPGDAADFLEWVRPQLTKGTHSGRATAAQPFCNLAFTAAGLRACGMDEDTLALFPEEFRQGMAARAGLLGDVRNNHPRRWRLPRLGQWPANPAADAPEVEPDSVHALLQWRFDGQGQLPVALPLNDNQHPLKPLIDQMLSAPRGSGLRLLAWQEMSRQIDPNAPDMVREHFGFADGNGQPDVEKPAVPNPLNRVHLGEVVLGHANAADPAPDLDNPALPALVRERWAWLLDGSFLVVRQYRQFVGRMQAAVAQAAAAMDSTWPPGAGTHTEQVYAKMMGRTREGLPLVPHVQPNTFGYDGDPAGAQCPLHAHVRLVNPRAERTPGSRPPRLMRRGMSYGPRYEGHNATDDIDRGLVFMAYNTSLGEQFEVMQRWLTGGNSTGSSSGQNCPILGVPENGQPRHHRFAHSADDGTGTARSEVVRVPLQAPTPLFDAPQVLTQLQWGLYLFAPSIAVMERLHMVASAAALQAPAVPWRVQRGRELLARLPMNAADPAALPAWKAALEDPDSIDRMDAAALWAALRADHGGLLRTPYGVLVAGRELIHQVLGDTGGLYSICGQRQRMKDSFGDIFLGMDAGPQYSDESGPVNAAIRLLNQPPPGTPGAFEIAQAGVRRKLENIVQGAQMLASAGGASRYEVPFDAREILDEVLARLCEDWFGVQDSPYLKPGSPDWHWQPGQPALYPGHFMALSRYMFQPNPGPLPQELSESYGQGLMVSMRQFVAAQRGQPGGVPLDRLGHEAPIAAAIFRHPHQGGDDDWVARTMVGVMMGFVAPIVGAGLNTLREWQRCGRIGELRAQLAGNASAANAARVLVGPLLEALRMRPMPQVIWRTVLKDHRLGEPGPHALDLQAGERVVLALVSGTQQGLAQADPDVTLMFGGDRSRPGHPTHACPGRDAGTMALLGTLSALLTSHSNPGEKLRPAPAIWGFLAEGPVPANAPLRESQRHPGGAADGEVPPDVPLPADPPRREGLVLAVGDSWLRSPYIDGNDLRQQLERWGWTVPGRLCSYLAWSKAETLAAKLAALREGMLKSVAENAALPLRGVLVSAGGNDSTGPAFLALLRPDDHDPGTNPLVPEKLQSHIDKLSGFYGQVLDALLAMLHNDLQRHDVPILLHGYDHSQLPPNPFVPEQWFRQPFERMAYDYITDRADELDGMKKLISQFNVGLKALTESPRYRDVVRWVDLQGTIAHHWNPPEGGWRDDLHPHASAFQALARKVDAVLVDPFPGPRGQSLQRKRPR